MWWWLVGGCVWITSAQQDEALDADGDGVSALEECDDDDPGSTDRPGDQYVDLDGDGYGSGDAFRGCPGPGRAPVAGDCDDTDPAVNPAGLEVCDPLRVDEDCDGAADDDDPEGAADQLAKYVDGDGDGFGDGPVQLMCHHGPGHAAVDGDCDDGDPSVNPAARERCGGGDEDCDAQTDEAGAEGATAWFVDADGDGFGDPGNFVVACAPDVGMVANDLDCDDDRAERHPERPEACDVAGLDDDCDGLVDDDDPDTEQTWPDLDGDGYGDEEADPAKGCVDGYVADDQDCDDDDPDVYPGQGC